MASVEALITPEVMRWAREKMGLSLDEAARKINRPVEDLVGWEEGTRLPTMPQLRTAAKVYKRSPAVFYLPEHPTDFDTLRDFRSFPDSVSRDYSPELALLIRTTSFRQQWMSDYLESEGVEPLPFVNSATPDVPASRVAKDIREILQVSAKEIRKLRTYDDAIRYWVRGAEAVGIVIFRNRNISLEEIRGFVMSDKYAPVVFINNNDAKAARIFTLAHELAHIWLGQTGLSNLRSHGRTLDKEAANIEVFCNQVAAEVILEPKEFREAWSQLNTGELDGRIERIARKFKVSEIVIARRLLQEDEMSQEKYEQVQESVQARWKKKKDDEEKNKENKKRTPIDYGIRMTAQNGHLFTRTVISGYQSGSVSGRDASELLDAKINNFGKLGNAVGLPV